MRPSQVNDDLPNEILKALRRILRKTADYSRQLGRDSGLTVPQVLCLAAVGNAPAGTEMTVARVADAIHLSVATASRLLDRLEEAGLLVRKRTAADRRKVIIQLTPRGRRKLHTLPTPLQEQFCARLAQLSKARQKALLDSLLQVVEMMGAADLEASPVLTPEVDVKPAASKKRS